MVFLWFFYGFSIFHESSDLGPSGWVPWVSPGSSGHARVDGLGHLGERAQRRIAAGQHGEPRPDRGRRGSRAVETWIYQDLMGMSWENI